MFWLYEDELPAGVGNERFCAAHLAWIALFVTLAAVWAFACHKLDPGRRRTAGRILGSAVFFFGLCEYGVSALLGHMSLYALPLHLCSLMLLLAFVHAWIGDGPVRDFLGAVLFFPGIPGTLSALLFPDWLYYPFWNYVSLSSFLAHGLLLVYGSSILVRIAEAPDREKLFRHDLRASLLFLGLGAAVMLLFDRATGANYWFLAGPSGDSPFLGVYERGGLGGYLAVFALTALAVTSAWYGLRRILFVRGRRNSK